jgi:hypothetical protein
VGTTFVYVGSKNSWKRRKNEGTLKGSKRMKGGTVGMYVIWAAGRPLLILDYGSFSADCVCLGLHHRRSSLIGAGTLIVDEVWWCPTVVQ